MITLVCGGVKGVESPTPPQTPEYFPPLGPPSAHRWISPERYPSPFPQYFTVFLGYNYGLSRIYYEGGWVREGE
jgi:hypothetical protein